MTGENGTPETPDWSVCPHSCPVFDLAEYARRKVEGAAEIPDNIILGSD